jgi:hypothetical protein
MPQRSFTLYNDILKRIEYWITLDDWIDEYDCNNIYFPDTEFLDCLMWNGQSWVLRVKPYPESHYL